MKIELLGSGCSKCMQLEAVLKEAIAKSAKFVEFEKVDDIMKMMEYQVISTPALVIDGKVVSSDRVLSLEEILEFLS